MTEERKSLGRGLRALIREVPEVPVLTVTTETEKPISDPMPSITREEGLLFLASDQIIPGRYQPRSYFNPNSINELSVSIKENGVIQPIVVKKVSAGRFELIAGERRLRAAQQAGVEKIPAIVRAVSDEEALELALIENLQREDLTPLEEANAYQKLSLEFDLTQEAIGEKVGKDRTTIANAIRLLSLPKEIQQYLDQGKLMAGHARAILMLKTEQDQLDLARRIIRENLTVRQAERFAAPVVPKITKTRRKKSYLAPNDPHLLEMEERLSKRFGTKVKIETARIGGRIIVEFYSLDDFERITQEVMGIEAS